MQRLSNFIAGELAPPQAGVYLDCIEPATAAIYAQTPASTAEDAHRAVAAAKQAFPAWSAAPQADRSRALLRLADLIDVNREQLAQAESRDTGKPITLARNLDIPRAAANLRFFATAAEHTSSQAHQTDSAALNVTLRSPRGPAGVISPWNLPLYLLTWKSAPALAVGCTVVAKPSEITPVTAHTLAELCIEANLPPGVLNIIHGEGATAGAAIVEHPGLPTISFTGGTTTGARIAQTAAPMFKRVALELGGKNPTIIFADADLSRAIPETLRAAFTNQGQICLCGSRILIERPIYQQVVDKLVSAARALRVGDPLDESTQQGALVSQTHLEKVEAAVTRARQESGEILCGGSRAEPPNNRCANGYFFQPTLIAGLDMQCATQQEEIFGPVATLTPFDTEEEAITLANATPYGLAASIWTTNLNKAHRTTRALDAGVIWVNCWLLRDLRTPFGGMKQSGLGREGGEEALHFFTETKNICFNTNEVAP